MLSKIYGRVSGIPLDIQYPAFTFAGFRAKSEYIPVLIGKVPEINRLGLGLGTF
jgi:hypothetical protein